MTYELPPSFSRGDKKINCESEGLRIISDGTEEGTYLFIDGQPLLGDTEVRWKIDPIRRTAQICFDLSDLTIDSHSPVPVLLRTLEALVANLGKKEEIHGDTRVDPRVLHTG